ncbi:MAG: hypothetical protein ACOCP4_06615, partial [Candidatus Woesearchaeota archaeon]
IFKKLEIYKEKYINKINEDELKLIDEIFLMKNHYSLINNINFKSTLECYLDFINDYYKQVAASKGIELQD